MSLSVICADQAEVDRYWDGLLAGGGEESQCGWLKDPWGLSWQIVPQRLNELMGDPDPRRAQAATQAMLKQQRIVIADLEAAADAVTAATS
jgi:predicted 3-demethylubiquinone-9 3-methyltransferase (glyoxalase superfamily)